MEFEVAEYSGGGIEVTRITRFGADEASAFAYSHALAGKGVYAEVHAEQRKGRMKMDKDIWYVMETADRGGKTKAESFKAKSLTSAKKAASRRQIFEGTVLYLGAEVDGNGFVSNPLSIKRGGKWTDISIYDGEWFAK